MHWHARTEPGCRAQKAGAFRFLQHHQLTCAGDHQEQGFANFGRRPFEHGPGSDGQRFAPADVQPKCHQGETGPTMPSGILLNQIAPHQRRQHPMCA